MTTGVLPLTLDKRGVAKLMNLSRRTVERMRRAGTFPTPLPFRRPRWSTAVVLRWLRDNGRACGSTNEVSSNSEGDDRG